MAISGVGQQIDTSLLNGLSGTSSISSNTGDGFDSLVSSALKMYKETDSLQKSAEQAEMNFALGYTYSTHDLALAQQKANISLQYSVKVTNKALEAYKEIMNMQL